MRLTVCRWLNGLVDTGLHARHCMHFALCNRSARINSNETCVGALDHAILHKQHRCSLEDIPGFPYGHSKYILFWKSNYKMQPLFTCNCNKQKIWNELLNISNSTLFMMYVYMYMESFLEQSNLNCWQFFR